MSEGVRDCKKFGNHCLNLLQHTMDLKWFFLFLSVTETRSVSPTQSCMSMKSDASKDFNPPCFREGELPSEQRYVELLLLSQPQNNGPHSRHAVMKKFLLNFTDADPGT